MTSQEQFFAKMAPYAKRAASATGRDAGVILAQWAAESGYGTSHQAVNHNNFGGIKYVGQAQASGYHVRESDQAKFASYRSINNFVDDFIRVMKLSRYTAVRNATTPEAEVKALSGSGYDEGGYGGGSPILKIFNTYGLKKYSSGSSAPAGKPKPPAPKVCPTCKRPL